MQTFSLSSRDNDRDPSHINGIVNPGQGPACPSVTPELTACCLTTADSGQASRATVVSGSWDPSGKQTPTVSPRHRQPLTPAVDE